MWQILLRERYARRKLREKEFADSKRHDTTSDIVESDLILLHHNRENTFSKTFKSEPYRVLEKNGNTVVIQDSAGQSKTRNAGHLKKFVDPGTEKGATENELPAPSLTTDTPKEGVILNRIQLVESQSQTEVVPLPLTPAREGPKSRPVRKKKHLSG